MRIIQYIPDFELGGVQKAGCVLAAEFSQLGHEAWVVSSRSGPRFCAKATKNLTHTILQNTRPETLVHLAEELKCDVLHIHAAAFQEKTISCFADNKTRNAPLIVSTPVFGRPPRNNETLLHSKACCVGVYTFYRLCRWLKLDATEAVRKGIGYVPLTPFTPPQVAVSANDTTEIVATRRKLLGINLNDNHGFVVGRIGRNDTSKWHPAHEILINQILNDCRRAVWLSMGFPYHEARRRLQNRWKDRFYNLPETGDFNILANALSSVDVQVFMSRNGECFSSTIAEAAGLGVPTIALVNPLKDNGQAEQIISGVTGELVADTRGMVDLICRFAKDNDKLTNLKKSCASYAERRWHIRRVSLDLADLYSFWRGQSNPDYLLQMLNEHQAFANRYHKQMIDLKAPTIIHRLVWKLLLSAVENWSTFKCGRAIKRVLSEASVL